MKQSPRGFSRNDLLAILMVAGIGIMIWLAVVQSAREASRRFQCVSNLKQIGIAMQAYHAAHGIYPLGATASFNPMSEANNMGTRIPGVPTDWSGWSPQAQMLSYLDQTPLFNSINFNFDPIVNGQQPFNATCLDTKVEMFLCPADPYSGRPSLNSYYASLGTNAQAMAHQTTGVFGYQQLCRARDVTDGQSTTVAFAEGLAGNGKAVRYRGNGVVNFGTSFPDPDSATAERFPDQVIANLQACNGGFSGPRAGMASISGNRGERWAWGAEAMALFNTLVPPNSTEYPFNQCRYFCGACFLMDADHSDIVNASSYHAGGANARFCDGGVRFVRGSMAMRIWWALGTRAASDAVSADSF